MDEKGIFKRAWMLVCIVVALGAFSHVEAQELSAVTPQESETPIPLPLSEEELRDAWARARSEAPTESWGQEVSEGLITNHYRPDLEPRQWLQSDEFYIAQPDQEELVRGAIEALVAHRPDINYCRSARDLRPAVMAALPTVCAQIDLSDCESIDVLNEEGKVIGGRANPDSCEFYRDKSIQFVTLLDSIKLTEVNPYRGESYHQISIRELPARLPYLDAGGLSWACVDQTVSLNNENGNWTVSGEILVGTYTDCGTYPTIIVGSPPRRNTTLINVPTAIELLDPDLLEENKSE